MSGYCARHTTSEQTQATITSWQTRHALAKEALLKSLEPAELIKVLPFRGNAAEMWTRLQQEYGRPLHFEYTRVNNEYMNLRHSESTSITDHIDCFNQLLQELEYMNDRKAYDPDKYCRHCQITGHDIHVCRKYAREPKEQNNSSDYRGNGNGNGNGGMRFKSESFS